MTAIPWEHLQGKTTAEAAQIKDALDRIPDGELPAFLALVKGMNCLKLGRMEEANRVLLGLLENDLDAVVHRTTVNDFRIAHGKALQAERPKVLTNAYGGRVGLSVLANADTVVFVPGPELSRHETSLITYRLNEDTFSDILGVLPPGWEPDYVLFFLTEVMSLPLDLEYSPYPVIGLPGDPWKANKASRDLQFFDAVMPAMKHMCPAYEGLGEARVLYSSCSGIQGHVPWIAQKLAGSGRVKDYDVVFTGAASSPFYRKRSRYLWRLLEMAARHRIFVGFFDSSDEFYRSMERTKIVVHCTGVQGGVNLRPFEAATCGALVLHEEGDRSITEFFEPGEEIVLFDEDNFEELLEYYITHDEERARIVARAAERTSRDGNIRLCMKRAIGEIQGSRVEASKRVACRLRNDQKWNALGISDFYATNYGRAAECFLKARATNVENPKHANNLAVCLMVDSLLKGEPNPEIEPLLVSANGEEAATPISRFNMASFYRRVQPDGRKFLKWSGELIRDLRTKSGSLPAFSGDELYFYMEGPNTRFYDSSVFQMEMEYLLLRFPRRGAEYQERLLNILLWRALEYTGDLHAESGQPAGALGAYGLALRYLPQNEIILKKMSDVQIHLGLYREAKTSLRKILELSPLHEEAHLALYRVEEALGESVESRARLSRLLRFQGLKNRGSFENFLEAREAVRESLQ